MKNYGTSLAKDITSNLWINQRNKDRKIQQFITLNLCASFTHTIFIFQWMETFEDTFFIMKHFPH